MPRSSPFAAAPTSLSRETLTSRPCDVAYEQLLGRVSGADLAAIQAPPQLAVVVLGMPNGVTATNSVASRWGEIRDALSLVGNVTVVLEPFIHDAPTRNIVLKGPDEDAVLRASDQLERMLLKIYHYDHGRYDLRVTKEVRRGQAMPGLALAAAGASGGGWARAVSVTVNGEARSVLVDGDAGPEMPPHVLRHAARHGKAWADMSATERKVALVWCAKHQQRDRDAGVGAGL